MGNRVAPFAVCVVVLALASIAAAQEVPVFRLTLEEAQARALAASHRLAEAKARESVALAVVGTRESADRPTVTAIAGYTRTNHVLEFSVPGPTGPRVLYPDVPDNYHTRLDLQWPIYTGGRTDALERAARAEAAAVTAETRVAQADLRLEVARAFWAVSTARAAVDVLEQGVRRSQAHAAEVRQRFGVGLVPPNEIASADAQESRARMLAIEARNQRDVSTADLARLVGLEPGQPVEPAATLEGPGTLVQGIEPLVADARASRQERTAMERRIEAANEQRAAAAAGRLPSIAVAGGVDYARPNPRIFPRADRWDDSWDAGINVRWSLWDGGRTAADVAQAAGLAEAARHRLAEFDSLLALEVRQRALDIDSGRAAVAAAADGVRAASEARRVVEERYRAGVIAQIEVTDAEFALLQAELDRTRALAGVRLSEARLARAIGR
ncbi:MAG TPA: TolC family protein [Vicinamibacterales bacterium]|nr:TolC family protein [Vicinamibacterales bacterium]